MLNKYYLEKRQMRITMNIKRLIHSSLFRSAGIYTITQMINSAIPFLLMPVLTRYLTPTDYGIVAMFGVLLSFVAPFTGLSINGAIARQYYERDETDMSRYISNCLLILLSSTIIVGITFYFLAEPISKVASFPMQWMWAVIIVSAAQFINRINLTLWQVQVRPVSYGIYQISQTVLNLGFSLWFVVGLGMDWQGRIQAQVIAFVSFAIFGLFLLYRNGWIKFKVDREYIKSALNFGVPLIPHSLGIVMMTMTDRIFITNMVGVNATGLYTVGYQIAMPISLLYTAFNRAYVPWLFEKLTYSGQRIKNKIVKLTYLYFVIILILSLGLAVIAPWLLSFFVGKDFASASSFVLWLAIGNAFTGMYLMVTNYIFYAKKTAILAWITFFTAITSIVLNYILISRNGAIGAAQAMTLTCFIRFMSTWVFSSRAYAMPWNILKMTRN
jgi:O-antigen/teichoic acid export membrane protein